MNSSFSFSNISASELRRAAEIKDQIEGLESELETVLGLQALSTISSKTPSTRNNISAAGLARIRAAQKSRWARFRANKGIRPSTLNQQPSTRRKMSPAARAKIAAIARARWRKARAAGRNAL